MKILKFKSYHNQSKGSICCVPYSIKMITDYYKIPVTKKSLIARCNVRKKYDGALMEDTNRVLKELNLKRVKVRVSKENFHGYNLFLSF